MAKSNIVDDNGTPIALLPSKSDRHYPASNKKKPRPSDKKEDKPTYRSTMEFEEIDLGIDRMKTGRLK